MEEDNMAILAECPTCHKKQAVRNRVCICGEDLVKAKKRKTKVRYWINYRLPNGKQRRECTGYNVEEANASHGKRVAQKYENPSILERVPTEKMTFSELASWYLALSSVMNLTSHQRVKQALANFTREYGNRTVSSLKPVDIENYQQQRIKEDGRAPATVDMEITYAKTMVTKAFNNDIVDGRTVKAFSNIKKQLKRGANARRKTIEIDNYMKLILCPKTPLHLRNFLIVAYYTGMRSGEIRNLKWSYIDKDKGMIRLPAAITKEHRNKNIPINHHVRKVLDSLPRPIHHDFVFTYKNKPLRGVAGLKRSFCAACKEVGILYGRDVQGGAVIHDIRRTFKTNMLNAGIDKIYRDLILGHSHEGMDAHYMAPTENDLNHAMARYTAWLDGQSESVDQNVDQEHIL